MPLMSLSATALYMASVRCPPSQLMYFDGSGQDAAGAAARLERLGDAVALAVGEDGLVGAPVVGVDEGRVGVTLGEAVEEGPEGRIVGGALVVYGGYAPCAVPVSRVGQVEVE